MESGRVRLGVDFVAHPVSKAAWEYHQGAYPILKNFLMERLGRSLSREEFEDFRLLCSCVALSLEILPPIDERVLRAAETALTATELSILPVHH